MTHEEISELIPIYAVGALNEAERAEVARHLKTCQACATQLADYQAVTDELLRSTPVAPWAPNLETRLRARMLSLKRPPFEGTPRRPMPLRQMALLATALALLVVLGFGAWSWWTAQNSSQTQELAQLLQAPGTLSVPIAGSDRAPQASGQIIYNPGDPHAYLIVNNLPPLPADQVYQAWLVPPDYQRDSAGTFTVDSNGHATVRIWASQAWSAYKEIGVTAEPGRGSTAPTTPRIVFAMLR